MDKLLPGSQSPYEFLLIKNVNFSLFSIALSGHSESSSLTAGVCPKQTLRKFSISTEIRQIRTFGSPEAHRYLRPHALIHTVFTRQSWIQRIVFP